MRRLPFRIGAISQLRPLAIRTGYLYAAPCQSNYRR
jgi:hypothetical protein